MSNKVRVGIVTIFTMVIISAVAAFAAVTNGTWVQNGTNWMFQKQDGTFMINEWGLLKYGNDYGDFYFDENGVMATGLKKIGSDYYMFNLDGTTKSNSIVLVDGYEYKTKQKGKLQDVFRELNVEKYNADLRAMAALENSAEAQAAQAEAAQQAVEMAALEANIESKGPRSKAAQEKKAQEIGPGMGMMQ